MPVSIRLFVIPIRTSETVDSNVDHTRCVDPIFRESMFKYLSVDFSLASFENVQSSICSLHF